MVFSALRGARCAKILRRPLRIRHPSALPRLCYGGSMRAALRGVLMAMMLVLWGAAAVRAADETPEATLKAYLGALKDARFEDAYDRCSKAMRQGKSKDDWVKEQKSLMAFADVKIF